jgi:RNA polymerase sigma-70 factor (ECF subfamily)
VQAAVAALPSPQRQALSLAFLDDLTHEQVAAFLNVPLGTAKGRIRSGLQALRARLAPLIAAGLALVSVLVAAERREHSHQEALRRQERALRLVTSSDVVPLRLVATPGTPAATHGNYRGRTGVAMAVITCSQFTPAPAGHVYRVWALHQGRWTPLGDVRPDVRGSDLLIVDNPTLVRLPEAVMVTLEPIGPASVPTGPAAIRWPL